MNQRARDEWAKRKLRKAIMTSVETEEDIKIDPVITEYLQDVEDEKVAHIYSFVNGYCDGYTLCGINHTNDWHDKNCSGTKVKGKKYDDTKCQACGATVCLICLLQNDLAE